LKEEVNIDNFLTLGLIITLNKLKLNIMKRNGSPRLSVNSISLSLLVLLLILCSSASYAQTPANFSGVWVQDTIKSDDFYKKFDVKYTIIQTPQTFKVKEVLSQYGSNEGVTRDYSYTLDGKVTDTKTENGTQKNLAQWSADKKTLKTRSTIAYGTQDVGFTETYSLSDNGLVLTVQKSDIIEGGLSVKQVFNKK
jgi:hypothetical protein